MKKIALISFLILGLAFSSFAEESGAWNIEKGTHFIIFYRNAKSGFVKQVLNKAEDYYNKIADDLGFRRFDFWLWDNRAKIYIYNDALDYQSATGQPGWSAGCALPEQKIIKTFPYAEGFLETVLPHEMGHIIFRELVGFNNYIIPLWLEEGVASYQEKMRYSMPNPILKNALASGSLLSVEDLFNFDLLLQVNEQSVELFYNEAVSLVHFLIKEFGRDKFVLFCQNLRDKKNFNSALSSSYPFSNIKEFNEAWQKYLRNG